MIVLVILLCLLLIGLIPVGILVGYEQGEAWLSIVFGFVRFPVYPRKHKANNSRFAKKQKNGKFQSHARSKKKRRDLNEYLPLVQLVFDFLRDFRTKLRINDLQFKAVLAGDDPCDLSISYGRVWAARSCLEPCLEHYFSINNRCIEIACNYTADTTYIRGYINMTLTISQIILIAAYHGVRVLRKYYKITNKAKDGAVS